MSTLGLALTLLALVAGVSCQAQCPGQMDADVLILGAGMAGLGAAEVLSENNIDNFLIIEQRHIVGGRVQTEKFGGGIVEVGAQWILSLDLGAPEEVQTPLLAIARRCSVTIHDVPFGNLGVARYNRRGENISQEFAAVTARYSSAFSPDIVRGILDTLPEDEDMTVSQGLRVGGWNARTQLEEHVENQNFGLPIAFPSDRASYRDHMDPAIHGLSFGPNPTLGSVVNYPEGYYAIPKCIADEFLIENDPRLILNTAIVEIEWGDNCICAISGTGQRYCAPYAIVTFSIGELQNGFVKFTPELPLIKTITLNQFEMGHFLKVYVSFNDTFWDPVDTISYFNELRGREYYPAFVNWGIRFPEPLHILEAIVTGIDESKRIAYQDPEITRQEIAQVMRDIYGDRALEPVDILVNDFIGNPFFFGNLLRVPAGVGRRHFDELNTPCGNMYLSGEGVSFEFHSTVHGAYIHGQDTAARIVDILQGPLDVHFINDTPRVEGSTIMAEFRTSKQADSIECIIGQIRQDCSSGQVSFSNLDDGRYSLRLIARVGAERAADARTLTVSADGSACGAHLINEGVSINGGRATIEFSSSGLPVSDFKCSLDGVNLDTCESPLDLRELPKGTHRLRIEPMCAGQARRVVTQFDIEDQ